jgi:hypothetical protein
MTRLSDGKQDDIDRLLKNNSLVKALQYSYSFLCSGVALDLVDSAIVLRHITTRNVFATKDTSILPRITSAILISTNLLTYKAI